MRTTLDLDEDVLHVAKDLAEKRGQTAGQVISELVRIALQPKTTPKLRNGVQIFTPKKGARPVSLAFVNKLRDAQ